MPQNPHQNQGLLWRALIISLVLHVVLMLQTVTLPSVFPDASKKLLSARLTLLTMLPVTSASNGVAPARLSQPHVPSPQRALPVVTGKATKATADDASIRDAATAASQTATATTSLPVAVPEGKTATANPAPSAQAQTVDTDFAESKKTFLFAIAAEARRVRKYPPRALAAGWGGTAYIRIIVTAGGNVQSPALDKSSGHDDIDNAALIMVRAALAKSPVPEDLRSRNFELILPVVFNLAEQ
jgi:protein TonB